MNGEQFCFQQPSIERSRTARAITQSDLSELGAQKWTPTGRNRRYYHHDDHSLTEGQRSHSTLQAIGPGKREVPQLIGTNAIQKN